jgi:hypothetical protein
MYEEPNDYTEALLEWIEGEDNTNNHPDPWDEE